MTEPSPLVHSADARFDVEVTDVPFRSNVAGRDLQARIYQPQKTGTVAGPWPLVLDLHGGAWAIKDRTAEATMDRALAQRGAVVVAIDLTVSGEAPYPANVQDANYAVRWIKSRASEWGADPSRVGVFGSSTGGHIAMLLAMRPRDERYGAIPLEGSLHVDARVACVATRSPITDPHARWEQAKKVQREELVRATEVYFEPWESIHEGNPQQILERGETVELPPLLIMQGDLDQNVLPAMQRKFADAYRAAGGECEFELFEHCDHEWTSADGPQTTRAHEMVGSFIAHHLSA